MSEPQRFTRGQEVRHNLRCSTIDGFAYMIMFGLAETYFGRFALEMNLGETAAGLITTVPVLLAAALQMSWPRLLRRLGSYRGFITASASVQALALLPLAWIAYVGHGPAWLIFLLATLYFQGSIGGGPLWQGWIVTLVPARLMAPYFGARNRVLQIAVLGAILSGGMLLDRASRTGQPGSGTTVFAGMFLVAAVARGVSAWMLWSQTEPVGPASQHVVPIRGFVTGLWRSVEGRLILYVVLVQVALQFGQPYWTPYVRESMRYDDVNYMLLVAGVYLGRMLALHALGRWAARHGVRSVLAIGGLGFIPFPALWLLSDQLWYHLLMQVLYGAFLAAWELGSFLAILSTVPESHRVSAISRFFTLRESASTAGSLLGGALLSRQLGGTYVTLFAVTTVLRLATAGLLPVLAPRPSDRPVEEEP